MVFVKRLVWILLLAAWPRSALALEVVTTLPDLAAITQAVGGDLVHVTNLAPPGQDPHYVDARPSLLIPLRDAHLLVINGLDLEVGWLPPLIVGARNTKIQRGGPGFLDVSSFVDRLLVPTVKIDRSMGDIHPGGNPHYTFDPRAARKVAAAIAVKLIALDPGNADRYRAQGQTFDRALETLATEEAGRFRLVPPAKRRVVVYHQSLVYLFDWLGLESVATVEPRPGIPPDPGHVKDVLTTMRSLGVSVVVQEDFYQRGPSETLARLARGKVAVIPGSTRFPEESYLEHLKKVTEALHAAIGS